MAYIVGLSYARPALFRARRSILDSEKYEIKAWDWDREGDIREDIALHEPAAASHPALQQFTNLKFYNAWNDQILYYGKATRGSIADFLLVAVNLDPHNAQTAHFEVPLWEFGLADMLRLPWRISSAACASPGPERCSRWCSIPLERPYAVWRLEAPQGGRHDLEEAVAIAPSEAQARRRAATRHRSRA